MKRRLSLALFAATVLSTLVAGSFMAGGDPLADPGTLLAGVPFSASLLLILGAHELAHYLASRRNGVQATWPLFIPAPSIIGTFGAVISIRSPIPHRRALLEIGAAGPLTGFLVAIAVVLNRLFGPVILEAFEKISEALSSVGP
jgi:membrane-associated protease RseP (regulator of RpoE activity)